MLVYGDVHFLVDGGIGGVQDHQGKAVSISWVYGIEPISDASVRGRARLEAAKKGGSLPPSEKQMTPATIPLWRSSKSAFPHRIA